MDGRALRSLEVPGFPLYEGFPMRQSRASVSLLVPMVAVGLGVGCTDSSPTAPADPDDPGDEIPIDLGSLALPASISIDLDPASALPVPVPDMEAAFARLPWASWANDVDPMEVLTAATRSILAEFRVERGGTGPAGATAAASIQRSTAPTYQFDEYAARERVRTTQIGSGEVLGTVMSAELERSICWDLGAHDQRSARAEFDLELEWDEDGAARSLRARMNARITAYTDNHSSMTIDVTVNDHVVSIDFPRRPQGEELSLGGPLAGPGPRQRTGGYDTWTVDLGGGITLSFRCPTGACRSRYMNAAIDILLDVLANLADGEFALIHFAALAALSGLPPDLEPREGSASYCLDLQVEPETATLAPGGEQVDLTTTVRDWYERPIAGAIVTYDNIRLGSISLPVAPTAPDGTRTSTYTSDQEGIETVLVIAGHSFFTDTLTATITVGGWQLDHTGDHRDIAALDGYGDIALLVGVTRATGSLDVAEDGMISGSGTGTFTGTQGAFMWDASDGAILCTEVGQLDLTFSFELTGRASGERLHIEASDLEIEVTSGTVFDCMGGIVGPGVLRHYLQLILETDVEAADGATDARSMERSESLTTDQGAVIGRREMDNSWRNTVRLGRWPNGAAGLASANDPVR